MSLTKRTASRFVVYAGFIFIAGCAKSNPKILGKGADDPLKASETERPSALENETDDEDSLLDRLFRESATGKAPRRIEYPTQLPIEKNSNLPPNQSKTQITITNSDPQNGPSPINNMEAPVPTPTASPTPTPSPTASPAPVPNEKIREELTKIPIPKTTPAPKPSVPSSDTETPNVRALWDDRIESGHKWTLFTIDALKNYGADLIESVPADIENFCPNYKTLNISSRMEFWVNLVSAIAAAESRFNPKVFYVETMLNSNGEHVVSRGLLQLSLESVRYYGCPIKTDADLEDPRKNIECGVRILNRWIPSDGVMSAQSKSGWLGGARYWSVLRPYSNKFGTIRKLMRTSRACQASS